MIKRHICITLFLLLEALVLLTIQSLAQQNPPQRPQTPKPPYPYKQREVAYANPADGTQLVGTLTIPEGVGPHPAVILIPGAGVADRDVTQAGHKPFLVIADYLTRRGIVVLRVDSRKADKYFNSTAEDFATDVLAGISFLKKQPEIDGHRIGLIGHSLGGMVAPMVAAKSTDVVFAVLLAGSVLPIRDISQMQRGQMLRARGLSEDEVRRRLNFSLVLYDRLAAGEDNAPLREDLREFIKLQLPAKMALTPEQLDGILKQELTRVGSSFYKFLHTYDPHVALRQVKCPVLAMNGSLDQAVTARENLEEIEKALRAAGNSDVAVMELYGLNHFFQVAKTGSPSEIVQIEETISPQVLQIMTGWIRLHAGLDK